MKKTIVEIREEASVLRMLGVLISSGINFDESCKLVADEFPKWKTPLMAIHDSSAIFGAVEEFEKQKEYFTFFVPDFIMAGMRGGSIDLAFFSSSRILEKTAQLKQFGVPEEKIASLNFFKILAGMLSFESSLSKALEAAGHDLSNEAQIHIFNKVMKQGDMLTSALELHPEYFDKESCRLISIGECIGCLSEFCEKLATLKEAQIMDFCATVSLPEPSQKTIDEIIDFEILSLIGFQSGALNTDSVQKLVKSGTITKKAFAEIASRVEKGENLSDALLSMPEEFPTYMAHLFQIAEKKGQLNEALEFILEYLKWEHLGIEPASVWLLHA